jgi:hypothetical protein
MMKTVISFILAMVLWGCSGNDSNEISSMINTAHLDHLYEAIRISGRAMGIVHIYSDYPDYQWLGDPDEGIACVDDAARAAVFYLQYAASHNNPDAWEKARSLIEFLIFMQAENGYFYNFLKEDHSIHKNYLRSQAKGDWWSYRAVWALTEALKNRNQLLDDEAARIETCLKKAVGNILKDDQTPHDTLYYEGIACPDWLPYDSAADQAGLLLIGLSEYYRLFPAEDCRTKITDLGDGILIMQQDNRSFPFGAFLSWQNTWHAWGNSQSYGLLKAAGITGNARLSTAALMEIDYFYTQMGVDTLIASFTLKGGDGRPCLNSISHYPQIAYDLRPIVFACTEAYKFTGDAKYARLAAEYSAWFFGKNSAHKIMYNPHTGRCFDGINTPGDVNLNAGAESTIEALLTLQAIDECIPARAYLNAYVGKNLETVRPD